MSKLPIRQTSPIHGGLMDDDEAEVVPGSESESQASVRRREELAKPKLKLKRRQWEPGPGNYLGMEKNGPSWLPLHHNLLLSRAFYTCDLAEVQVLFHFLSQFKGRNSGKLTATLNDMKRKFRWGKSPNRLKDALAGLVKKRLIRQTKERIGADPAWYALTWLKNHPKKGRT